MAFHDTINTGTTPNDGQGDGLRTNIRKLHDNTKDNKKRLDDLNGNTPGVVRYNGVTILTPIDGARSYSGTSTGAIKITLPQSWGATMLKLNFDVYDYNTDESFSFSVSGYLYPGIGVGSWYSTSAQIIASKTNRDFTIRLGHNGSKCVIYVGELNSTWSYLKVACVRAVLGHGNSTAEKWLSGWGVGLESSSFQNITRTHTNNLLVAQ